MTIEEYAVMAQRTNFHLPGNFSEPTNVHSQLFNYSKSQYNYDVGNMLIAIAVSDLIENYPEPTDLTYEELIENIPNPINDLGKMHCEKKDMPITEPVELFLQHRYSDVEWDNLTLRKAVQALILRGAAKVETLAGNHNTAGSNVIKLIRKLLPDPDNDGNTEEE